MRTRSPALRDATSSSESGVVTSLMPSRPAVTLTRACPRPDPRASPSQRHLLVPMRVALDGHRHRQGRDVTGIAQDVDTERGRVAAVALGADAQAVGALEQLVFQPSEHRIGVRTTELAEQRPFRQDRGFFKGAADADAEDQRWAGVGTGRLHALDDEVLDRGAAGVSIVYFERFSHPPPLAMIMTLSVAPGTTSTWTTAGVLSPVFTRSNGERTMEARR